MLRYKTHPDLIFRRSLNIYWKPDQIFSKNPYIFDRNSNRNLVISQTNSLKLIAPFPSWSISLISSWNKYDDDDKDSDDFISDNV